MWGNSRISGCSNLKKLLIATTNAGKLRELTEFLSGAPVELVSLVDLHITQHPAETGETFEENAILKAKFYQKLSGLPTLADDGGLEIDALEGAPGVRSHRWVDPARESSEEELIAFTIKKLEGISLEKRQAQLRVVLALAFPDGKTVTVEDASRGVIPLQAYPKWEKGYQYRSLLYFPEVQKYYIELSKKEMEKYNHRKRAVNKLKSIIDMYFYE